MGERGPTRERGSRGAGASPGGAGGFRGALLTLLSRGLADGSAERVPAQKARVKFGLRSSPDAGEDGCALAIGQQQCLEDCKFNMTAKTFFIIHGWTVSVRNPGQCLICPLRESKLPCKWAVPPEYLFSGISVTDSSLKVFKAGLDGSLNHLV